MPVLKMRGVGDWVSGARTGAYTSPSIFMVFGGTNTSDSVMRVCKLEVGPARLGGRETIRIQGARQRAALIRVGPVVKQSIYRLRGLVVGGKRRIALL